MITQRGCVYITMATRRDAEVVHRELKYCELPIDQSKKGGRGKQNIEVSCTQVTDRCVCVHLRVVWCACMCALIVIVSV